MPTPISLEVGATVGAYQINKVLATSQYGVLYRATSKQNDRTVNIQEFLPREFSTRTPSDGKVRSRNGKEQVFEEALTLFLQEARVLAQIHDPYISRIHEYTETNGTAYLVMEHDSGQSLAKYLSQHRDPVSEKQLRNILIPILKGLRVVHGAQLLHRDITPSAIFLRRNGPPLLTWFGACHRSPRLDSSLNHRVTPGFSAIELYHENPRLEPASDLYSLGAVMYRCLAGSPPVDPTQRIAALAHNEDDPMVPASELGRGDYSNALLGTIDWMLHPMMHDRPESAGAVLGPLTSSSKPTQAQSMPDSTATKEIRDLKPASQTVPPSSRVRKSAIAVSVSIIAMWLVWALLRPFISPEAGPPDENATDTTLVEQTTDKTVREDVVSASSAPTQEAVYDNYLARTERDTTETRMDDPNLTDPPPEVPGTVTFARSGDDERAAHYRQIERRELEIQQLLDAAHRNIAEGKPLIALPQLRRVQVIDANNPDAKEALAQIADQLLAQAKQAFANREMGLVDQLLGQIDSISPDYFAAEQLRQQAAEFRREQQRLETAKQLLEQQKLEEISELLSKGSAAAARNQYIQPPGDNALEYYRKALGLGPQNEKARAGIDRVALAFLERANRALAADDFDRAETHLTTAAAIQPENQAIGLLRKQINARRAAAQRRRSSTAATTVVAPPSPLKQVSKEEQKVKQAKQDLERGIDAYYAGAYDKARRLLNILAQQGFARAQFRLGMMYYLGRGVPQNRIIATEWIRKALPDVRRQAQEGVAWAQADLGSLYEDGLIVERDTKTAVRWYTRAAEQGYAGAQTNLGVMYAKGVGVEPDIFEAIKWLERAAAQGDRVARQNLLTLRNEE